ncbi:extracellular solute-binding protein [Paenibacillus sp. IITD108]|uniref:extracellular solute-binding protein n=1 Tax=Paenibacillus sp. IITD108 TaxID=3116649 RepID=UPI002F3FD871
MRKNGWFMMLSVLLVFAVALSACGDGGKQPEKVPASSDAVQNKETEGEKGEVDKTKPDPDKKYSISFARSHIVPPDNNGELIKYFGEKFNVEFDAWNIETSKWHEILNLKFASREIPDFMDVIGFEALQKYVKQDILAEIPVDMLKEYAPFIYEEFLEAAVPDALKYGTIDGKVYGIPIPNQVRFRKPIVWRGDWLKNVGIDKAPETFEEFEAAMYKFANDDPDRSGKKDTYGLSESGLQAVYGAFGYLPMIWQERDGKLVYGSVQPEMKEALATLSRWYKDGVLDPEFITGENQGGYYAFSHAFMNNRIGFTSLGDYYHWKPLTYEGDSKSEIYLELQKVNPAALETLIHGVPPKGSNGAMGVPEPNAVSGNFIGFGKQLEDEPDKMAKILQILNAQSEDYEDYMTSIFGIKGKHWDYDPTNGFPGFINDNDSKTVAQMGLVSGLEARIWTIKRAQPRIDWALANHFDVGGISNALLSPLPSDGKYKEELKKIEEESFIHIITGDKPIDYFDEFVEKWRKAGGEQLEKEANEWYQSINE